MILLEKITETISGLSKQSVSNFLYLLQLYSGPYIYTYILICSCVSCSVCLEALMASQLTDWS